MRRRARSTAVPAPPAALLRFEAEDWPAGPEPVGWGDSVTGEAPYPWPLFSARLAWLRARRAWIVEQGGTAEAREAVGPAR